MRGFGGRLLNILARALEPVERDVVLGDLAESGKGVAAGVHDLLGLVVRRQAALWTSWPPWLALVGISCFAGLSLSGIAVRFNVDVEQQVRTYSHYGVRLQTGLTAAEDLTFLLCLAGALIGWSWTCGFVLGSLSGRAAWLPWVAFYFVVLDSAWVRLVWAGALILPDSPPLSLLIFTTLPVSLAGLLFLFPSLLGTLAGVRRQRLPPGQAKLLGCAIAIATLLAFITSGWYETARESWSGGAWQGVSWPQRVLPFLFVSWPAIYMVVMAHRPRTASEH